MKSGTSVLIGLLAVAFLGVSAVAWRQHQELAALRSSDALSTQERADLQKRLFDAQKRLKELQDQLAALPGREGDLADDDAPPEKPDKADKTDRADRRRNRGPGGFGNLAAALERPEVQRLMQLQQKAQLDSRYAALFKSLNLSPDQLDKLKNLLVERQSAPQDVLAAARAQGIDPRSDPTGMQKMIASTQADVDASIKQALGDQGYAQYQQYQQTLPQRGVVNQLQQSLSYTSAPLTDTQSSQLVQILAQTSPAASNAAAEARAAFLPPGVFGSINSTPITNQAITLAQGVLAPSQVAALQQLQAQQQAQQQLQQSLRAAAQQAGQNRGGGGGATTPRAARK